MPATSFGFSSRIQVSNGSCVDPSARYHARAGVRVPIPPMASCPKNVVCSANTWVSDSTRVATRAFGTMLLTSRLLRPFGGTAMVCSWTRPSWVMKPMVARAGPGSGFWTTSQVW
jgi:hypothetical protein